MTMPIDDLRGEILGRDYRFQTPFGEVPLLYADYMASGRCLAFVDRYLCELQRTYANTHTEDDLTGETTGHLLRHAMEVIKRSVNASERTRLLMTGSGTTDAIRLLQEIIGVRIPPATRERLGTACFELSPKRRPVVFVSPYEHHSNEVSWRECLVDVVEVAAGDGGQLDLQDLETKLTDPALEGREKIGCFSAASNVTGIVTAVFDVARILHRHGALAFFDFAASAPYTAIDMNRDAESYFDAIFFSPHKFVGGPGSSGVLLFDERLYRSDLPPTVGGGGTVDYVSPWDHDYARTIEIREHAGTPGILQTLRAAVAVQVKERVGVEAIAAREAELIARAFDRLGANDKIQILGDPDPRRCLAVMSFNLRHHDGYLHPKLVTRLLNDLFGIQSRAGCACAGPYGHRLLGIGAELSGKYREQIREGRLGIKPGWVRVGFHFTMTDSELDFLCSAIELLAEVGAHFLPLYRFDLDSGVWRHKDAGESSLPTLDVDQGLSVVPSEQRDDIEVWRAELLERARSVANELRARGEVSPTKLTGQLEALRFFEVVVLDGR